MNKEDIINYVMTTPNNPNRAVLEGMLDSIAEAGGGTPLIVHFNNGTADVTPMRCGRHIKVVKQLCSTLDGRHLFVPQRYVL